MHHKQLGCPRKTTNRIVDMVRSKGKAAGKTLPPRFPVVVDAVEIVRGNCSKKIEICDEWETFSSDTKFDPEQ